MRYPAICLTGAAAIALASCGSDTSSDIETDDGESGEYTIDSETGEASMTIDTNDGEVTMRTGSDVPVDLPAGFTLIGGAEVVSNTVVEQPEGKGVLLTFRSDRTADEIVEFYREQAESAGIAIQMDLTTADSRIVGGDDGGDLTFSISASAGEDGTTGQLTISEPVG